MSNAEQERIEKAWEEAEIPIDCVLGENKWAVMKNGFRYGFLAGRADAMELPEVRAEELVVGEIYRYRGISSWFPVRVIAMFEECVRLEEFGVHGYADIPFKYLRLPPIPPPYDMVATGGGIGGKRKYLS